MWKIWKMKDQFSSHRKHNENENKKKIVASSVLETQAKFVLGMWGKFTRKVYSAMSLSPGNFQGKRGKPCRQTRLYLIRPVPQIPGSVSSGK